MLNYPRLLPADFTGADDCDGQAFCVLDRYPLGPLLSLDVGLPVSEARSLGDLERKLDGTIAAAVRYVQRGTEGARIALADVYGSSVPHDCAGTTPKATVKWVGALVRTTRPPQSGSALRRPDPPGQSRDFPSDRPRTEDVRGGLAGDVRPSPRSPLSDSSTRVVGREVPADTGSRGGACRVPVLVAKGATARRPARRRSDWSAGPGDRRPARRASTGPVVVEWTADESACEGGVLVRSLDQRSMSAMPVLFEQSERPACAWAEWTLTGQRHDPVRVGPSTAAGSALRTLSGRPWSANSPSTCSRVD